VCFVGLAANNALLVIDRVVVKDVDMSTWRLVPAVVGAAALVYGLMLEDQ
jgi:hypothetical protein